MRRWYARPSAWILMVQDPEKRRGLDEEHLQRRFPKTWAYLKRFEKVLRERAAFKRYFTRRDPNGHAVETAPFYSMFDVGSYTFAPWKVVWRYIAAEMTAVVISQFNGKIIVPDHRLIIIALQDEKEAYYLSAILNNSICRFLVNAFIVSTQISTHILYKIKTPCFDSQNPTHINLANLSRRAHELAPRAYEGDEAAQEELRRLEEEIDRAAARLWGLTEEELFEIKKSLEEIRGKS